VLRKPPRDSPSAVKGATTPRSSRRVHDVDRSTVCRSLSRSEVPFASSIEN
jgi:hypothetical protein